MPQDVNRTVEAIWRIESPRLIAGLARTVRDVGLAEDLSQEALVAALEQWPSDGIPDNPGAWLMSTARHRGIDRIRRERTGRRKAEEIGRDLEIRQAEEIEHDLAAAMDDPFDDLEDDLLRLVFTTCHPVLAKEARAALTLRLLGGLTTPEIASAYLLPESTVAQRIVRAKRTLKAARVPIEVPSRDELPERRASVLEVIYLIFNEGYFPSSGELAVRTELLEESMRLGRILTQLMPDEPEVHGLLSLMELQASRTRARTGPEGEAVPLPEQNRARWDRTLIRHGLASLERAYATGGSFGPYALQAAIAACHARANRAEATDWVRIAALYDGLAQVTPSPVVQLNRAVATGMAEGAEAALAMLDDPALEEALKGYALLPAARADALERLGRHAEAKQAFEEAASLSDNARQRDVLLKRAAAC